MTPYTLQELLAERESAVRFGLHTHRVEVEIADEVQRLTMAARLRHPSAPRSLINEARDIMDASARPFDQDAE